MCRHCDRIAPLCPWRAAHSLEAYFAKWECHLADDSDVLDEETTAFKAEKDLKLDIFCHQPNDEERFVEAKEDGKEARPAAAPSRLVILRPGDNVASSFPPKEPKAAARNWFPPNGEPPEPPEMLFGALLLCMRAIGDSKVQNINRWASDVVRLVPASGELPAESAWRVNRTTPGTMIEPIYTALRGTAWSEESLETIATVMQNWHGAGRTDELHPQLLRDAMKTDREPLGPKPPGSKKKFGPPRLLSSAVRGIAEIVKDHGVELRKMLKMDEPRGPTMAKELESAVERIAELEKVTMPKLVLERDQARGAHREAAKRNTKVKEARKDERAKMRKRTKEKQKADREAYKAARRQELEAATAVMVDQLDRKYADRFKKQRIGLNTARAKAREAVETTQKVQRKLQRTERKLEQAQQPSSEEESDVPMESADDLTRLPFELRPRRDERGCFQAEADELHSLRLAQSARGVPPSTISANIQDVIALIAPQVKIPQACPRQQQLLRGQVTICGEGMAAYKFAMAKRILFFGWDESTKFGDAVFGCSCTVEYFDGTREDICLRGLTMLPDGGTSKAVLTHIEESIFSHCRQLLTQWISIYEKKQGIGSWAANGHPSPENLGLHRLCEDTVLMTDTCNGARCTKRMLSEAIISAIKEKVGVEKWEAMSTEERNTKYRVIRADCWQHLRNIMIDAMAASGDNLVKEVLADSLDNFSSFERIEVEGSSVIHAVFKHLHHIGEYAKGRGREFDANAKQNSKEELFLRFARALGSRQDLKFDGCVPLFTNRLIILEFLRGYLDCPKSQNNKLDTSIYTILKCNEFVALLRANSLWKYIFSEPFRWLSGKTAKLKEWSLVKMSGALDEVEKAMQRLVEDPSLAFDPDFDMFENTAAELPEFGKWREELLASTGKALDGKTEHCVVQEVLQKARTPAPGSGEHHQAEGLTLKIIKAQAARALEKLHNPRLALADKLQSQDGKNSAYAMAELHERLKGIAGTNDASENKFAAADYVMRFFRGISTFNASGIVQQRAAHDFDWPVHIISDRRKRKRSPDAEEEAQPGFFWRLSPLMRSALLELARRELQPSISKAQQIRRQHDQEKLKRREEALTRQLNAVVEKYAAAMELYDQWRAQGVATKPQLEMALKDLSPNEQIAELRRQIKMRTVGLGWQEFETKWGFYADEKQHTIQQLTDMLLKDILPHERALGRQKKLPAAAALPPLKARTLKVLGTVDADALRIEAKSLFNVDRLLEKALAARTRREAAGISDSVEAQQPPTAPAFDIRLVGKRLEICWPYKGPDGKTFKIWASGMVKRVADGLTDKAPRGKKILPAGALLWAWDADAEYDEAAGERWLILLPGKWNNHVQYAWRFDPCELGVQGAQKPPLCAPRVDECETEEEYLTSDEMYLTE